MNYLRLFENSSDFEVAKTEGLDLPNVSYVKDLGELHYFMASNYEFVDLGLPSGLKWAAWNVGAKEPHESGLYFAWGETKGYNVAKGDVQDEQNGVYSAVITNADGSETTKVFASDKSDYELYDSDSGTYTKYSDTSVLTLSQEDDACYLADRGMRMPTKEECEELINGTTSVWTTNYNDSGVKGAILTSTSNGNSIFVPAVGRVIGGLLDPFGIRAYFWSSSLYSSGVYYAFDCDFGSSYSGVVIDTRYGGVPLRAVQD